MSRLSHALGKCSLWLAGFALCVTAGLTLVQKDNASATPSFTPMHSVRSLAARLVPLTPEQRPAILKRIPGGDGSVSQLASCFDGTWYVHKGDLTIDGDFATDMNLVVDGNLTVRGVVHDGDDEASLVVTGDLRAHHVLSCQLVVVMGSLECSGVVHADYNDYEFEVWGPSLTARALILSDRSARLPEKINVSYKYNSHASSNQPPAEGVLVDELVRWYDDDANLFEKTTDAKGKVQWKDEGGEVLNAKEAKSLKLTTSVPADFEIVSSAVMERKPLFRKPSEQPLPWYLDAEAKVDLLTTKAQSSDVQDRVLAASHPQLPEEWVTKLASDPDPSVRAAAVHHPRLDAASAAKLAADKEAAVRRQVAASGHAASHLESLVIDPVAEVRRACASHPALTDAQRRKLLNDDDATVRGRALRYLPKSAAWVKELQSSKREEQVAWTVQHAALLEKNDGTSSTTPADWQQLALDPRPAVREAALSKVPYTQLFPFLDQKGAALANDSSVKTRRAVAGASRDADVLTKLAQDSDALVRRTALDNLAVPDAVLIREAERLAKAPAERWNTYDAGYAEHTSDVHPLLEHPRLPAEALLVLHKVYPRTWRLEPVRHLPLSMTLDRAQDDSPALQFDETFGSWRKVAADFNGDDSTTWAALLKSDEEYLKAAARQNAHTPLVALMVHAKSVKDDRYALRDVARNPQLGGASKEATALLQWLLDLGDADVNSELAGNPYLPVEVLKGLVKDAPEKAITTLWQRYGVIVEQK